MSRWRDQSSAGLAAWASLSLEERIADRVSDILLAASEIHDMVRSAGQPSSQSAKDIVLAVTYIYEEASRMMLRLPQPGDAPQRDPELVAVLDSIRRALIEIEPVRGADRDVAFGWVEKLAAPYALALFYEIERLDELLGYSKSKVRL